MNGHLKEMLNPKCNLVIEGKQIKQVTKFKYLVYLISSDGTCTSNIGQEFNVAFDTSSSMTWVPSIHAPLKYRIMHKYKRYDNESSRTHTTNNKQFDVLDNSVRITGHFSLDSLQIAGLTIKNQSFGETLLETNLFRGTTNDGILGLGFSNLDGEEEPSVFDNMVSQGLVQDPVFSIYLNRYNSGGPDSVLTLGGTNPYYREEEFTFINLTVPHRWQFNIDRVQLSKDDDIFFSEPGGQAVIDSSSSFIAGPMEETRAINELLGGILFEGHYGLVSGSEIEFNIKPAFLNSFLFTFFTNANKSIVIRW
ncbi:cathepsin d [Plakobranchus ocellatus]|uniref:Cathepsin d n=1 Tax=Plakobranchus ocellatus TaxID=259542 RepID=A0AAV3YS20_9GAST|nr:cathepsin d [Plakobranchus ocellatus]